MTEAAIPIGQPGWDPDQLLSHDPERYVDFLRSWRLWLRQATDVGDAIERAQSGQVPEARELDLDDSNVVLVYRKALQDVAKERRRQTRDQRQHDLVAAGLLAVARMRGAMGAAA